ncbi:MAG: hypothetical protein ACTSWE_02595 [Promethearchaeota archaeon]
MSWWRDSKPCSFKSRAQRRNSSNSAFSFGRYVMTCAKAPFLPRLEILPMESHTRYLAPVFHAR